MPALPHTAGTGLEVISPEGSHRFVRITESPFLIGRGNDTGNHLQLDDPRISRRCGKIVLEDEGWQLEDRGHVYGLYVNGKKLDRCPLQDGDIITFGIPDSYKIIFRASDASTTIENLIDLLEVSHVPDVASNRLHKLNVLLEATTLLHSRLPLDSVLASMVDHAVSVTNAERGMLLETDEAGVLRLRLARGTGGAPLPPERQVPSQTALRLALERQSSVITEDLTIPDVDLYNVDSILRQELRAIVSIPLYASPRVGSQEPDRPKESFLGILYLDSRERTEFSRLDRQILDALASEAASILDNARLVERDRQRQMLEHELNLAREIQQGLLPRGFRDFPHLSVTGINVPCFAVGGDYFDVFPLSDDQTVFLVADVSGKGLSAALLTTMLQGALAGTTIGADTARVFQMINRFLCEHSEIGHYATIFLGVLNVNGGLDFINAGHPYPLLLRAGEVTQPFTAGSCPVGLFPEATFVTAHGELRIGDTLVLYSDGVTEAMNADGHMYGAQRLREVLTDQEHSPLVEIQSDILKSVKDFVHGAIQRDDITLLLMRYHGEQGVNAS